MWGHLPYIGAVLDFEHALLRTVLFGEGRAVTWLVAPDVVLDALAAGRWPVDAPAAETMLEIAV